MLAFNLNDTLPIMYSQVIRYFQLNRRSRRRCWLLVLLVLGITTLCLLHLVRSDSAEVFLLVIIHATAKPEGRIKRDAIRNTWASNSLGGRVTYRFVLGGKDIPKSTHIRLLEEQRVFHDLIILDNVTDSHDSLTERTLQGFLYMIRNNHQFTYLLKCDDDTFVNIATIAKELSLRTHHGRFYWGEIWGANQIELNGTYAELGWSICETYLPYAFGGGYVLSRDLVVLMAQNTPSLKVYNNEDVSIGAWLAPYNVEVVHDARFDTGSESRGCKPEYIVTHTILEPQLVEKYFHTMKKRGMFCTQKDQWSRYAGHVYDWSGPPSQCCKPKLSIP